MECILKATNSSIKRRKKKSLNMLLDQESQRPKTCTISVSCFENKLCFFLLSNRLFRCRSKEDINILYLYFCRSLVSPFLSACFINSALLHRRGEFHRAKCTSVIYFEVSSRLVFQLQTTLIVCFSRVAEKQAVSSTSDGFIIFSSVLSRYLDQLISFSR